jgi:hypothetical protein
MAPGDRTGRDGGRTGRAAAVETGDWISICSLRLRVRLAFALAPLAISITSLVRFILYPSSIEYIQY